MRDERSRGRAVRIVAFIVGLSVVLAACSSAKTSGSKASSAAPAVSCTGSPVTLGMLVDLTGLATYPDDPTGAQVAVDAVNRTCAAGRPVKLEVCDGKSDVNQSITCARRFISDHVVATVGTSALNAQQAETILGQAGIPNWFNLSATTFESTSPLSFPGSAGLVVVLGAVSVVLATGAKSMTLVIDDIPQVSLLEPLFKAAATAGGATLNVVLVSTTATDLTQAAAQALAQKPGGILVALGLTQQSQFLEALNTQGMDTAKTAVVSGETTFPLKVFKNIGAAGEGMYLVASALIPSPSVAASNTGIAQMVKEYTADGKDPYGTDVTQVATIAWAGVHLLAQMMKAMTTVTATNLVAAINAYGPINRPELAPLNFAKNPFPSTSPLSATRTFSSQVAVLQVKGGTFVQRTKGFVDIQSHFSLTAN